MATMFPDEVEEFTTAGEGSVYHFLHRAARPDSSFLAWYSPDVEGREPDFILLSPDCGLIVFEIKDWLAEQIVEANPKEVVLRIGGKEELRKQPLAQAREYVNHLLSLLAKDVSVASGVKRQAPCPVTWGAVFPHIRREEFNESGLATVIDASRILFWDDICDDSSLLRDASGQTFRHWLREHFPPLFPFTLSIEDINWIRARIFPVVRIDLPQRAGSVSAKQTQTIMALDHEQENLARTFGSGSMLLIGPSGSAKTLILAHQAWHLPRVDRHIKRILFTCFNLSLVGYIRRLLSRKGVGLGPNGVEVIPFYSLCERVLGEPLAHSAETSDFYALVVQETLSRLDGKHPLQGHWNAIFVDEGQDFSSDMAQVILRLLPCKGGNLTVALDENQCLYQENSNVWQDANVNGLRVRRLNRQYRNTKQIARFAERILGKQGSVEFAGADGPEPEWIVSSSSQAQIQDVTTRIIQLVQNGVPMSEIAILYTRSKIDGIDSLPEALLESLESHGILARWVARDTASKRNYDITTDSVTISTIYSVKGMDFAYVFLFGLDLLNQASERDRRLAYVGVTRAREQIYLLCKERGNIN